MRLEGDLRESKGGDPVHGVEINVRMRFPDDAAPDVLKAAPEKSFAAVETPAPAPGETHREPAGGPRWRVQFGAVSKEANALRVKARLAGELADMLAADDLDIDDSKGDGLLRVVLAHAFAASDAAEDLCVEIKARGRDCYVARASGPAP